MRLANSHEPFCGRKSGRGMDDEGFLLSKVIFYFPPFYLLRQASDGISINVMLFINEIV